MNDVRYGYKRAQQSIRICSAAEMRELDRVAQAEFGLDPLIRIDELGLGEL